MCSAGADLLFSLERTLLAVFLMSDINSSNSSLVSRRENSQKTCWEVQAAHPTQQRLPKATKQVPPTHPQAMALFCCSSPTSGRDRLPLNMEVPPVIVANQCLKMVPACSEHRCQFTNSEQAKLSREPISRPKPSHVGPLQQLPQNLEAVSRTHSHWSRPPPPLPRPCLVPWQSHLSSSSRPNLVDQI